VLTLSVTPVYGQHNITQRAIVLLNNDLIITFSPTHSFIHTKISFNNAPIPYTIPHTHTANNKFTIINKLTLTKPLYLFQILIM